MRRAILTAVMLVALAPAISAQATGLEVDDLRVGQEAPNFVMKRMGTSNFVFLHDYAGELRRAAVMRGDTPRVVVLSFFATWCKPCAEEMPHLTEIAKEYADRDVVVFFVDLNEQESAVETWLKSQPAIDGDFIMDPYAENAIKYGVEALPRTVIIGKDGIVWHIERGFETEGYRTKVRAALDALLGGS